MDERKRVHYCRVYSLEALQKFPLWAELVAATRAPRTGHAPDSDSAFVWSDFRVTTAPFPDSQTVYDGTHQQWREFCQQELGISPESSIT